jgi:hypothetical protein
MPIDVDMTDPVNPEIIVAECAHMVEVDDPRIEEIKVSQADYQRFP